MTASTNADMVLRAHQGAREGLWLRAERQTAGRGRAGRQWESPAGNFYGSTLVRLREDDPPAHSLSMVAALAVVDSVNLVLPPQRAAILKWPNDVLIGQAKLAGILLERKQFSAAASGQDQSSQRQDIVIVGIGINITNSPQIEGRETISLHQAGAHHGFDAAMMAEALAEKFAEYLAIWRVMGLQEILERWQDRSYAFGTCMSVRTGLPQTDQLAAAGDANPQASRLVEGRYDGLDEQGALRLKREDGTIQLVTAGDVALIAEERN